MVLNGDIMEYENGAMGDLAIAEGGIDAEAIMLLINFVDFLWATYYPPVMHMRGGAPKRKKQNQLALRQPTLPLEQQITFTPEDLEFYYKSAQKFLKDTQGVRASVSSGVSTALSVVSRGTKRAFETITQEVGRVYDRVKRPRDPNPPITPDEPFALVPYNDTSTSGNNRNSTTTTRMPNGTDMLSWKNTLTRMYHTYQQYVMSPIKQTYLKNSVKLHATNKGNGPSLYWSYWNTTTQSGNVRDTSWNNLGYWDGGMGTPVTTGVARNYGLGATGTRYFFADDWPGT